MWSSYVYTSHLACDKGGRKQKIEITELEAIMIRDALNEFSHGVSEEEEESVQFWLSFAGAWGASVANHKIVEVLGNDRHKKSS